MAEASAAGVHPHLFWDYTWRELYAVLQGSTLRARRDHKLALFNAWHGANLRRGKRLPELRTLLRKLDPVRVMSAGSIRAAVMGIAQALGANVVRKKKRGD